MKFKHYFLLSLLLLSIALPASAQGIEKGYIILYDESHDQFFTSDMMSTAFDSLSDALGVQITIKVNTDKFTTTSLQGADLLIVSNPGVDSEALDGESDAIKDFVSKGTGVLYMSNPFSYNSSLAGHAETMNQLIFADIGVTMSTGTVDIDNTTIIVDEFNNNGNETNVYIGADNLETDVFRTEVNNLTQSKFLLYSAIVSPKNPTTEMYGNASEYSYAINQNYDDALSSELNLKSPRWMEAKEFSTKGRAMLLGSTTMFSEYAYNSTSNWIDQEDNLKLFQNLIAWLLHITPLPEVNEIVNQEVSWFITYNIFVALGIGILLIILWFGSLWYQGKLSISNFFAIGKPLPEKPKKDKSKANKKKKNKRRKT